MPVINKQRTGVRPETASLPGPAAGPPSVWDQVRGTSAVIYGPSASGKTTVASTLPGPTLWLLCSGGNKPGELKSIDTPENRQKITPRVISSVSQLRDYLVEARNYQSTILDHTTGFADLVLKEILGISEIPAQKGWGLATQQQYGQQSSQCKEIFRQMLNLPGNVVFICQERTFGGREEGMDPEVVRPTVGPALSPSMAGWLCPACDLVVQTFKRPKMREVTQVLAGQTVTTTERLKGVDFCLRTGPHDYFLSKFRIPRGSPLPDYIIDPDWEKIETIMSGKWQG